MTRTIALTAAAAIPALACVSSASAQITPTVVNTIPVSTTTFGATLSPDGKSVWIANYADTTDPGQVSLLDIATQTLGTSIAVGAGPADIAFSQPGGRAFVTNLYGDSLSVIDSTKLTVTQTIDLSALSDQYPFGVAYGKGHVSVSSLGSSVVPEFDTTNPLVLRKSISVAGTSGSPTTLPDGTLLVPVFDSVNNYPTLDFINPTNSTVGATLALPSSAAFPQAVVASPDGKTAYVSLFDSAGGNGGVWVVNVRTRKTITVVSTGDVANYGEAVSADGKYLLVAGFLQNQIALIDTKTYALDYIIQAGNQPNSIALTKDGSEGFFTNQGDGTVSVVTFAPSL